MNKTLSIASLSLASLFSLAAMPSQAKAGDNERAAIAGFIGGVIVGSAVHHNSPPPLPRFEHRDDRRDDRYSDDRHSSHRHGRWETVSVKVWVPARWIVRDNCGRRERYLERAHYEYRTERVWTVARR